MEAVDARLSRADQALTESVAASVDVEQALDAVKRSTRRAGSAFPEPQPGAGTGLALGQWLRRGRGRGGVQGVVLHPLATVVDGASVSAEGAASGTPVAGGDPAARAVPATDLDLDFHVAAAPPVIGL